MNVSCGPFSTVERFAYQWHMLRHRKSRARCAQCCGLHRCRLPLQRLNAYSEVSRATKSYERRLRTARLRHIGAAPEDVDYRARHNLDKALFQQLLTGKWIRDNRNLKITGPCGVGKTWLACALAQAACL